MVMFKSVGRQSFMARVISPTSSKFHPAQQADGSVVVPDESRPYLGFNVIRSA